MNEGHIRFVQKNMFVANRKDNFLANPICYCILGSSVELSSQYLSQN